MQLAAVRLGQRLRARPLSFARTWLAVLGLAAYAVANFTIAHPFLLADNRRGPGPDRALRSGSR